MRDSFILNTKLYVPLVRQNKIYREALENKLNESLQKSHRIILVSAPAGYGKTTLAAGWINSLDCGCTWISLDESANDPINYINYLIAAIRKVDNTFGQIIEDLMASPKPVNVNTICSYIIKELEQLKEPLILVLDDYHVINNSYINDIMQKLFDLAAPNITTVILTRQDPPFTLSRWRVKDMMTEVKAEDLKFNEAEIKEFFRRYFGIIFDDDILKIIEERTEGWAASLQLTGLSIKNMEKAQVRSFVEEFKGNNRFIIDYLMDEVIERQEEGVRNFLNKTCTLKRFSVELCDAVAGIKGSKSIIEQLERENLFIVPLDNSGTWYRYHHIFSEFLRLELDEYQRTEISKKAGLWCRENGFTEEALEYALEARDGDMAESLLKQEAIRYYQKGEIKTLLTKLNLLTAIKKERDVIIDVYRVACLYITGEVHVACDVSENLEAMRRIKDDPVALAVLQLVVSLIYIINDVDKAYKLSVEAAANLKESHEMLYYSALMTIGLVKTSKGHADEAVAVLSDVYEGTRGKGYRFIEMLSLAILVVNLDYLGRRKEALFLCEEALKKCTDKKGNLLPMTKLIYQPMGILLYHNDRLDEALKYLEEGLAYRREIEYSYTMGYEDCLYIRLLYTKKDKDVAIETLYKLKMDARSLKFQEIPKMFDALGMKMEIGEKNNKLELLDAVEAELYIKEKNLEKASEWLKRYGTFSKVRNSLTAYLAYTYIRALLLNNRLQEAEIAVLEQERQARQYGRNGELITVLVLAALIKKRMGMETEALEYVKEALAIAAPEGYQRSFMDEDNEIIELAYKVREVAPEFVGQLMEKKEEQPCILVETLSDRELEILELIAVGLSNAEIADKLYITTGTVKWHIINIYNKLGVNKRTQAVEKARQLRIIY